MAGEGKSTVGCRFNDIQTVGYLHILQWAVRLVERTVTVNIFVNPSFVRLAEAAADKSTSSGNISFLIISIVFLFMVYVRTINV